MRKEIQISPLTEKDIFCKDKYILNSINKFNNQDYEYFKNYTLEDYVVDIKKLN